MRAAPPCVAFFCATFLKPEMLHVHRQIAGLQAFRPVVIAQKREGSWPVESIEVVRRSPGRFLARAEEKRSGRPWQISGGEAARVLSVIRREKAVLLHVFFGNVAVHLLPLLRRCPIPIVVSFHGSDVAGSMASEGYSAAREELFTLATVVPCRSEQLATTVAKLGCPESKTRLMRTVLPDIPFMQREPPVDGAWKIVQAARLVRKKGLSTAVQVLPGSCASIHAQVSRLQGRDLWPKSCAKWRLTWGWPTGPIPRLPISRGAPSALSPRPYLPSAERERRR